MKPSLCDLQVTQNTAVSIFSLPQFLPHHSFPKLPLMAAHGCSYLIQNTAGCSLQSCTGICSPPIRPGPCAAIDASPIASLSHKWLLVITHRSQPSAMAKWLSNSNQTWSHILSSVTGRQIFIMSPPPRWIISFLFLSLDYFLFSFSLDWSLVLGILCSLVSLVFSNTVYVEDSVQNKNVISC